MQVKFRMSILAFLLLLAGKGWAISEEEISSFTLKNGIKVILLEDHSIPQANMYTFWKVGSRNEVPGITGLSHFFEHMMFNGSKKYPPGSFDKVMEAAGGSNNAYTTNNVTVYTNWFPTTALATIIDLEADRIAHLEFDDQKIDSERQVVLSERSTNLENSPWELLYETTRAVAFNAHPYSWPVIGWESDIKAWTKADLQKYFQTYYDPSNAVMVFVGSFAAKDVRKVLEKKIQDIPSNPSVPRIRTVEPPQVGERRAFVKKESSTAPLVLLAYHIPESKHPDRYALDVLGEIMSSGPSSRLIKALVDEQQLAVDISTELPLSFDPELFMLMAQGREGKKPQDIERALLKEIETLKIKGVTALELEKAKNKIALSFYRNLETINGKAQLLGDYEVFHGDYKEVFRANKLYQAVTTADVKRVLNQYFTKENRSVGIQDKQESNDRTR